MTINNEKLGYFLIFCITLCALLLIASQGPIVQDLRYHAFRDNNTIFGIPNFLNVISNIPFLMIGALGLYKTYTNKMQMPQDFKIAYLFLFLSLVLIAFGSAYYHLSPDNKSLLWDRLPMTVGLMSLFSIMIYEFVSSSFAKYFFWPAIIFGASSVIYWYVTEQQGQGDLRVYIVVQFLPVLLAPVILIFFHSKYSEASAYWCLLVSYLAAKLFEQYDEKIYDFLGFISGHSLKHIFAALGFYILLISYQKYHHINNTVAR